MVRSERCLRRWYLSMSRLSECRSRGRLNVWWLSRWTRCKSWLRQHWLREGSLKLNSLWVEWKNVKLGLSFYSRVTYNMGDLIISTVRGVEIRLDSESICCIFDIAPIGLRFRGFVDFQTPTRWENPQHTVWRSSVEYYTICCALFFYHEVDTKMRSFIMRHSLLTPFWLGDGSIWGNWWWCTWSHVARARLVYSPMAISLLEYSRMSTFTWAERRTLRPPAPMIRMMISPWGGWNLRRL